MMVWTDNETELVLNAMLECKVVKEAETLTGSLFRATTKTSWIA